MRLALLELLKINQQLGLACHVILLAKLAKVIQVSVQVAKSAEAIFKVEVKQQLAFRNAFKEHML